MVVLEALVLVQLGQLAFDEAVMLWMMRLLQQQLCLRVLRPRTGLREADLQQHHSFDPQVDAVVDRSWVRTARVWRSVRSGALVRAGVQLGCTAAKPFLPFLPRALLWFCPRAVDQ